VVLERSRTLKRIDDQPVWSVTCFFIIRPYRRRGVSVELLNAAVEFAKKRGAKIVEGYPVIATSGSLPDAFAWTGIPGTFLKAGFKEVARPSRSRPIMRRIL
jgi:GNAT superfamily N-acetyltransferase